MISAIHIKLDVHKLILYENCVDTYGNKSALGDGYPYSTHSHPYLLSIYERDERNRQESYIKEEVIDKVCESK
jgi:hypothetical protein